jgi:molybdopterin/thiamine biosynthesis adenylyltransferase
MEAIGPDQFSAFERDRYQRQLRLDDFGPSAQAKLKATTVMVSRVGGVGGTIALNLAIAGIGRLVLAHGGSVVPEYLNRWPWSGPADVDRKIIDMVTERIRSANPLVDLVTRGEHVNEANVAELVSQADIVADGAPLFEERYLMNAEACRQRKPIVSAAMYATEGYAMTIVPGKTPCLRCIYPERPEYWDNIKVFPAIGPSPAVVGAIAAMEVIKLITGYGMTLAGTLLYFDLKVMEFRRLNVKRDPNCPVCGKL